MSSSSLTPDRPGSVSRCAALAFQSVLPVISSSKLCLRPVQHSAQSFRCNRQPRHFSSVPGRGWSPPRDRSINRYATVSQGPSNLNSGLNGEEDGGVASKPESRVEEDALAAAGAVLILRRAARVYVDGKGVRPSAEVLSLALQQLESVQRKQRAKTDVDNLYGQWRLVFITSTSDNSAKRQKQRKNPFLNPFRSTFFPFRAHQTFNFIESEEHNGEFDNGVFLLGKLLYFRVIGPMRWVADRNRLEFSVDRLKIGVGSFAREFTGLDKEGYSLAGRTAKTLPFFTFCLIRNDIAVARGRSGGMALYTRVPDGEYL